jgi:hypothetical protein
VETIFRIEAGKRIESDPDSFWRGEIVPIPDEPLSTEPLAAAATAFKYWARLRRDGLAADLAMLRLKDTQELVRWAFNPPHSEDPEFVLCMARWCFLICPGSLSRSEAERAEAVRGL